MTASEMQQAVEAIFRIERARLIAGLARMVCNVDLAEEMAQDAQVVVLTECPRTGVPANPGAWLMATAKRRAIDALRRRKMRERKHEEIARGEPFRFATHKARLTTFVLSLQPVNVYVGHPADAIRTATSPCFPYRPHPVFHYGQDISG